MSFEVLYKYNTQQELLTKRIHEARSVLVTTHRKCDADGLGSALALHCAMKRLNKQSRVLCVDEIPERYHFLISGFTKEDVQSFSGKHDPVEDVDLIIVLDTNDSRLVEPLFSVLKKKAKTIVFLDHHELSVGAKQEDHLFVLRSDVASTGELVYNLLEKLNVPLDRTTARLVYASIVFDTQVFRYIRNKPDSYRICIELLKFDINPEEIHRELFTNYSKDKIRFLSFALSNIKYIQDSVAVVLIDQQCLQEYRVSIEETQDIVDLMIGIKGVKVAAFVVEESSNTFKVSFRSREPINVFRIAESLEGGGHIRAAGATLKGSADEVRKTLSSVLQENISSFL